MSALKHLVFIVNPRSGTDRVKAVRNAIDSSIDRQRYTYELLHTARPKHGIDLAREAAGKGAFAVIAIGGDGSVNDVVTGLIGSRTALGIIPKGSGNGMARTMEIPLKIEAALEVINKGNAQPVDIAYANGRPFISNAGVGFDALISKKFTRSKRRGLMAYSWLVTKYLWLYNEWDWRITIDGKKIRTKAFLVNVANGQQFGYNFKIAPDASYNDGLLDLIIIRKFPKLMGTPIVVRAMNGTLTKSRYVDHYRGKEITIAHPDLKLMQTDGDAHPCTNRITFSIEPGALNVLMP
jgi:diacylglycerol kinase (ATP)